jgi:hypothetical protein
MRSMVEGVRLRNAPSPFPHHRASRGPPPPPCGGRYPPYATLTLYQESRGLTDVGPLAHSD